MSSRIQRGITGSSYDHIALVLCYSSGRLCLLEATQATGVCLLSWDDFMSNGFFSLTERIVHRRLEFDRTEEKLLLLDDFVKKVKGKAYKFTPIKLLSRSKKRDPGEEDDFFCSELIASAYKALRILSENVAANSFLPGNFSDEKNLDLLEAKLGPELIIDFDL